MQKNTYILIHGAWHASWCWKYIVPKLKAAGHDVFNINLPGHGNSENNFAKINLATYRQYLIDLIKQLDVPVILVGHSFAGVMISDVAEQIPDNIAELIYITAFMPENGGSLTTEAEKFTTTGLSPELIPDPNHNSMDLKRSSRLAKLFYHLCSEEDVNFAAENMQKEPLRPMLDTIQISEKNFGRVKKTYIECEYDQSIVLADQRRMHSQFNCNVISIPADHSPFFSTPNELVAAILSVN